MTTKDQLCCLVHPSEWYCSEHGFICYDHVTATYLTDGSTQMDCGVRNALGRCLSELSGG